jgi:hypothetical protein
MNPRPPRSQRGARVLVAFAVTMFCLAGAGPLAADELPAVSMQIPWEVAERRDDSHGGYVIYKRRQASGFDAYRLEAEIAAPPSVVAEAARRNIVDPNLVHDKMQKNVLRTEGNVAWVYSYIDLPMMVSDRDVITRSERSYDEKSGIYRLDWSTSTEGPAPKRGVVRLQHSSGSWVFSPLGNGRTRAVYENFTDIGGRIPAWVVNPMMNSTVTQSIVDLRQTVDAQLRTAAATSASSSLTKGKDAGLTDAPGSF